MPLPIECFTIGTRSRCLAEKEDPVGDIVGLFREVQIIHIIGGHKDIDFL